MKQRIGLKKALEQPVVREGAERAMATLFWSSPKAPSAAQVHVLPSFRPVLRPTKVTV